MFGTSFFQKEYKLHVENIDNCWVSSSNLLDTAIFKEIAIQYVTHELPFLCQKGDYPFPFFYSFFAVLFIHVS